MEHTLVKNNLFNIKTGILGFLVILIVVLFVSRGRDLFSSDLLEVNDQPGNDTLFIEHVILSQPGYVVFLPVDKKPTDINDTYGHSVLLEAGEYLDFRLTFFFGTWLRTQKNPENLLVAIYKDSDGDGMFSIHKDKPIGDGILTPRSKIIRLTERTLSTIKCNDGFTDTFSNGINTENWQVTLQNIASGGLNQTAKGWHNLAFTKSHITGDFDSEVTLTDFDTEHVGTHEYGAKLEFMVFTTEDRLFAINWAKDYYGSYIYPTYKDVISKPEERIYIDPQAEPRLRIVRKGSSGSMFIDAGDGYRKLADVGDISSESVMLGMVTMDGGYRTQRVNAKWNNFSIRCPQ